MQIRDDVAEALELSDCQLAARAARRITITASVQEGARRRITITGFALGKRWAVRPIVRRPRVVDDPSAPSTPRHAASPTRPRRCSRPAAVGRARPARLRVLLPVVRHLGARRRLPALVAGRARAAERHRLGVLPRARPLLVVRPARDRRSRWSEIRGAGHRRDRRLVVGAGARPRTPRLPAVVAAARARRRRRRRAPRAVRRPHGREHGRATSRYLRGARDHDVLRLPAVRPARRRLGGGERALHAGGIDVSRRRRSSARRRPRGFDGVYTYDIVTTAATSSHGSAREAHATQPAVRAVGRARATTRGAAAATRCVKPRRQRRDLRRDVARGDRRAAPTASRSRRYNEWHEGTQIEPAAPPRAARRATATCSYDGAWGLHGRRGRERVPRRGRATGRTSSAGRRRRSRRPRRRRPPPSSTPRSCGWSRSTTASGHASSPSAAAPSSEPNAEQRVERDRRRACRSGGGRSPRARAAPRAGRCARSSREPMHSPISRWQTRATGRKPSPRFASVVGHTQMRAPASREQVELAAVGVRRVDDGRARAEAALAGEQLDRPQRRARRGTPRSRAAARRRGRGAAGRARARSGRARAARRPGRRARSGGRRRRGCPSPRSASSCAQVVGDRLLPEARDPAAQVAGVEADELDAGLRGGLGRRARLVEAEVVELADGGVAVGAQLAVDLDVLAPDSVDASASSASASISVAPGPEVAAAVAAAQRALERVAVGVDEARASVGTGISCQRDRAARAAAERADDRPARPDPASSSRCSRPSDGGRSWPAAIVFGVAGITDQIDGFLARRWHVESAFGKIADPLADRLMIDAAVILLCTPAGCRGSRSLIPARDVLAARRHAARCRPRLRVSRSTCSARPRPGSSTRASGFVMVTHDGTRRGRSWIFWIGLRRSRSSSLA